MKPSREGESGFTLLETLAAVAVMAAILGSLATLAGQWMPSWRHGFSALQGADLIGLALDRIAEDVASAEYARLDAGPGAPLFRGEPNGVVFVRRAIGPQSGPRLEIVRLIETSTQQGVELQRSHASFAPGAIGAYRDPATLLRPPFSATFAYAGPDGAWRSTWADARALPQTVRVSVRNDNGALTASIAFALKVTAAPEIAAQQGATQSPQKPDAK